MTRKEINNEELTKVSGGGAAQSRAILEFFKSRGYHYGKDEDDEDDLDLYLMDMMGGTKLADYCVSCNFSEDGSNVYGTTDGEDLTHEQFMKLLRETF